MRFQELVDKLKPKAPTGLDSFGSDKCDFCHKTFDPKDAKIWTAETGKVHFSCYLEWKKQRGNKRED